VSDPSQSDEDGSRKTIADLLAVMAALRTPVTGCPWDLEQSFASIAPYTIEEAYEVADAIEREDRVDLKEELGDLLLQVVYHARLAEEERAFEFADVVDGITRKMVRRHPHVFGNVEARTAGMAKDSWERIKAVEKAERARARTADRLSRGLPPADRAAHSVLSGVPAPLPALTRAAKLQDKAARVGFDWPNLAPVLDKLREELAELEEVALPADPRGANAKFQDSNAVPDIRAVEEELGDLLFVVANVARHLSIDPETALRRANSKFERRFAAIESRLAAEGRSPEASTLEEMDKLWNEVKVAERSRQPG